MLCLFHSLLKALFAVSLMIFTEDASSASLAVLCEGPLSGGTLQIETLLKDALKTASSQLMKSLREEGLEKTLSLELSTWNSRDQILISIFRRLVEESPLEINKLQEQISLISEAGSKTEQQVLNKLKDQRSTASPVYKLFGVSRESSARAGGALGRWKHSRFTPSRIYAYKLNVVPYPGPLYQGSLYVLEDNLSGQVPRRQSIKKIPLLLNELRYVYSSEIVGEIDKDHLVIRVDFESEVQLLVVDLLELKIKPKLFLSLPVTLPRNIREITILDDFIVWEEEFSNWKKQTPEHYGWGAIEIKKPHSKQYFQLTKNQYSQILLRHAAEVERNDFHESLEHIPFRKNSLLVLFRAIDFTKAFAIQISNVKGQIKFRFHKMSYAWLLNHFHESLYFNSQFYAVEREVKKGTVSMCPLLISEKNSVVLDIHSKENIFVTTTPKRQGAWHCHVYPMYVVSSENKISLFLVQVDFYQRGDLLHVDVTTIRPGVSHETRSLEALSPKGSSINVYISRSGKWLYLVFAGEKEDEVYGAPLF